MKKWFSTISGEIRLCPPGKRWRNLLLPIILAILFMPLTRCFFLWAGNHKEFIENVYCRRIYPVISHIVSALTGWIPFSLAEMGTVYVDRGCDHLSHYPGSSPLYSPLPHLSYLPGNRLDAGDRQHVLFCFLWAVGD